MRWSRGAVVGSSAYFFIIHNHSIPPAVTPHRHSSFLLLSVPEGAEATGGGAMVAAVEDGEEGPEEEAAGEMSDWNNFALRILFFSFSSDIRWEMFAFVVSNFCFFESLVVVRVSPLSRALFFWMDGWLEFEYGEKFGIP
jgi:hypothetical protein